MSETCRQASRVRHRLSNASLGVSTKLAAVVEPALVATKAVQPLIPDYQASSGGSPCNKWMVIVEEWEARAPEHASQPASQPMPHFRESQLHLHLFHAGELRSWVLAYSPSALLWTMVSVIGPFKLHMRKEACGFQQTSLLFLIYPSFTDCQLGFQGCAQGQGVSCVRRRKARGF